MTDEADRLGLDAPPVVVVSGLPRSGTSLMMQMLDRGGVPPYTDGTRQADEDNPKGYYEHGDVLALGRTNAWVANARGHALKVITTLLPKMPADLPCAVILLIRDLEEVLASQAKMLERSGKPGGRLAPAELKSLFARDLDRARAWADAAENVSMIEVSYAETVAHPRECVDRIASYLDQTRPEPLDRAQMVAAIDPSLYRNRCA